jgi:hypothetical protein
MFEITTDPIHPTCLPVGLNKANLKDITELQHKYRVFLDIHTQVIHDGNEYAKQAFAQDHWDPS